MRPTISMYHAELIVRAHKVAVKRGIAEGSLTFLLLQQPFELDPLIRGENLFNARPALAKHRPVVLPEIVEDRFDLLGLRRVEVQFLLQALEIYALALGGLESRGALAIVNAQIHHQGAGRSATKEYQRQTDPAHQLGTPGATHHQPVEQP